MMEVRWDRYPLLAAVPSARTWLTIQGNLGLASATIDAYGRALQDYLTFCTNRQIDPAVATREHIAAYVGDLAHRPRAMITSPSSCSLRSRLYRSAYPHHRPLLT